MKKTLRPFSVETRRAGRKVTGSPVRIPPESGESVSPEPVPPAAWPLPEEHSHSEARRAADALFSRPAEPAPLAAAPSAVTESRRVLPALDEEDHIARLLEEEEAQRPRRGRKPAAADVLAPLASLGTPKAVPVPMPDLPRWIAGYVRGKIFARYARRSEAGPGQYWRKRIKPAW